MTPSAPYTSDDALRSLASYLGVGGLNADQVDPRVFEEKIRWGIEHLCEAERLRQLVAVPWVIDPNVAQAIERLKSAVEPPDKGAVSLSVSDAQWLLGEIEGGQEAFGTVVNQNAALRYEVAKLRQNIDGLLALRRRG